MNVKTSVARMLASGFGSGYSWIAPGTCGSAVALAVWWCVCSSGLVSVSAATLLLILAAYVVGFVAIPSVVCASGADKDPQWIVIDEWAGLFTALIAVAPREWHWVTVAFILFRFFDATKLGPIGWAEMLPGSWGIMADDIVAGAATALVIWGLRTVL